LKNDYIMKISQNQPPIPNFWGEASGISIEGMEKENIPDNQVIPQK
jgi:hypothetical protein